MSNPAAALRVARPVVAGPAGVEAAGADYVVVDRVRKVYNEGSRQQVEAVAQSSFTVKAGEFVALLGPSGCGKSTLLMMIAGLEDRKSTRLNSSHMPVSRMPSSA